MECGISRIESLDNPCRVPCRHAVVGHIPGDHASRAHHRVPPDADACRDHDVGAYPCAFGNAYGAGGYALQAYGAAGVLVVVVQPGQHHVLRHDGVVAYLHGADEGGAQPDADTVADEDIARAVVHHGIVFDGAFRPDMEPVDGRHVQEGLPPDDGSLPVPEHEGVQQPFHPQARAGVAEHHAVYAGLPDGGTFDFFFQ